jgi:hypothetical protein
MLNQIRDRVRRHGKAHPHLTEPQILVKVLAADRPDLAGQAHARVKNAGETVPIRVWTWLDNQSVDVTAAPKSPAGVHVITTLAGDYEIDFTEGRVRRAGPVLARVEDGVGDQWREFERLAVTNGAAEPRLLFFYTNIDLGHTAVVEQSPQGSEQAWEWITGWVNARGLEPWNPRPVR